MISDTLIPGYSIVTRAMAQDHELTSGNPKKETVKRVIVTLFFSNFELFSLPYQRGLKLKAKPRKQMSSGPHNKYECP